MARARGLEPLSYGFGDRYVTITPSPYMAGRTGFEPTQDGLTDRCLNHQATYPYIRRIDIVAAARSDIIQRR